MKPLSHRFIEGMPMPAYLVGIVVAIIGALIYLLVAIKVGLVAEILSGEVSSISLRASLTLMILAAYLPVAHWYLRAWTARCVEALNRVYPGAVEAQSLSEVKLTMTGLISLVIFLGLFLVQPDDQNTLFHLSHWTLDFSLVILTGSFVGWSLGRFSLELVWSALQINRLAQRLPVLNLFDTDAHKPFTQQGVQSALLIVTLMSITSNIAVQPGSGLVGAITLSITMSILTVVVLILPMRGIHKRLQSQKHQELQTLRGEIQIRRKSLLTDADKGLDKITPLLAMEQRIERVPEWPFDLGSLSKVMLYLLLGLGSWVGAALVERLLEQTL